MGLACSSNYTGQRDVTPKPYAFKSHKILNALFPGANGKGYSEKIGPLVSLVVELVKLMKSDAIGCPRNPEINDESVAIVMVSGCGGLCAHPSPPHSLRLFTRSRRHPLLCRPAAFLFTISLGALHHPLRYCCPRSTRACR